MTRLGVVVDADVLAASMTRELLITGARLGHTFTPMWSERILAEFERAISRRAARQDRTAPPASEYLREAWPDSLIDLPGPSAEPAVPAEPAEPDTHPKDRHVVHAAITAGARVIVTRNLLDYGDADLRALSLVAVDGDRFLAAHLDDGTHLDVLADMSRRRSRPPKSVRQLHMDLQIEHPELHRHHSHLFQSAATQAFAVAPSILDADPVSPPKPIRGANVCIRCGRRLRARASVASRLGPECRRLTC